MAVLCPGQAVGPGAHGRGLRGAGGVREELPGGAGRRLQQRSRPQGRLWARSRRRPRGGVLWAQEAEAQQRCGGPGSPAAVVLSITFSATCI